ncbi:MmyB family transcriptional regulator [Nocardia jiangsuensis]|uniref:Helix-turn-helix domain-containing protein n=1 Tax=Nocardia jiangsuensis TaxID=1691563 RepID=A0ABV8DPR1_9NOCA
MRQLRIHYGWTRLHAAQRLHMSDATVKRIEIRQLEVTAEALESIVVGFDLDRAQERFTRELAQAPVPLAPLAELRERAAAPEWRTSFAHLDDSGVACAFIDPLWNVVAANDRFAEAFPGLGDFDDNLALWHFHPGKKDSPSVRALVHRDDESAHFTKALRAALGRHRADPRAHELLRQLRASADFSARWKSTITVAYGRGPGNPVHLRDQRTGERYTLSIQLGKAMCEDNVQFCTALRDPYTGPSSA